MKNPFAAVQRPVIDPDSSLTPGYTQQEWATLLLTARDHHRVAVYRKCVHALLLMLYTCCLRALADGSGDGLAEAGSAVKAGRFSPGSRLAS
ncbi:hypothetical protein [Streptomyces sp. CC224B]|uniref:hypothetical protein n=1 Tax=Streptomyces sp. CC224B TaxID=3044571 RepID=UPI0024A9D2E8|nr:hypothetical protein [Streptomyces sp. CC224B]